MGEGEKRDLQHEIDLAHEDSEEETEDKDIVLARKLKEEETKKAKLAERLRREEVKEKEKQEAEKRANEEEKKKQGMETQHGEDKNAGDNVSPKSFIIDGSQAATQNRMFDLLSDADRCAYVENLRVKDELIMYFSAETYHKALQRAGNTAIGRLLLAEPTIDVHTKNTIYKLAMLQYAIEYLRSIKLARTPQNFERIYGTEVPREGKMNQLDLTELLAQNEYYMLNELPRYAWNATKLMWYTNLIGTKENKTVTFATRDGVENWKEPIAGGISIKMRKDIVADKLTSALLALNRMAVIVMKLAKIHDEGKNEYEMFPFPREKFQIINPSGTLDWQKLKTTAINEACKEHGAHVVRKNRNLFLKDARESTKGKGSKLGMLKEMPAQVIDDLVANRPLSAVLKYNERDGQKQRKEKKGQQHHKGTDKGNMGKHKQYEGKSHGKAERGSKYSYGQQYKDQENPWKSHYPKTGATSYAESRGQTSSWSRGNTWRSDEWKKDW